MPSAYRSVSQDSDWKTWYETAIERLSGNRQTDTDVKIALGIIKFSNRNLSEETLNLSDIPQLEEEE